MSMPDYQLPPASVLNKFILDKLTVSSKYKIEGNRCVDTLFNYLKSFPQFKIGVTLIGGSMGKDTALGDAFTPDYDLVVLLNDEEPPFEEFLDFFNTQLKIDGPGIFNGYCGEYVQQDQDTPPLKSIKFKIGNYKFDLLPGSNLRIPSNTPRAQLRKVLTRIPNSPSSELAGGSYSTSLTEFSVDFVKSQTPYVKKVIRLAKYWNKCVPIGENVKIPGRSTIIELVAIHANKGKTQKQKRIWTGFKRFLVAMTELQTLEVIFKDFYTEIPSQARANTQAPFVWDPINPYDNIADGLGKDKEGSMAKFIQKAKHTLATDTSVVMDPKEIIGEPYMY